MSSFVRVGGLICNRSGEAGPDRFLRGINDAEDEKDEDEDDDETASNAGSHDDDDEGSNQLILMRKNK